MRGMKTMLRSLSVRVLLSLIAGLTLGGVAGAYGGPGVKGAIAAAEPIGQLWLNGLRMTVVPLIFSVMVTGVAGVADAAATGRLAVRALAWFLGLLTAGAIFSIVFGQALYSVWPLGEAGAAALRAGAHAAQVPPVTPSLADFVKNLAPSNPIKAAAENAVTPLVVFAIFFGFAVTRLAEDRRRTLVTFFESIAQTMIVIVRWVLLAAPVGVFALAMAVGIKAGVGAAGTIAHYVVAVSMTVALLSLAVYLAAPIVGRIPFGVWARANGPVQTAAVATQSSLACLPAMIERSRDSLGLPDRITGLVLPLAVSMFRLGSPAANFGIAVFAAQVYGIHPGVAQWAAAVMIAVTGSIGVVGLPSQVNFFVNTVPISTILGLPLDLLPILLAVEVIPDIFRTLASVTGDMAVTAAVGRGARTQAMPVLRAADA
jgi:Na+/H+-dicarboxylate symporter